MTTILAIPYEDQLEWLHTRIEEEREFRAIGATRRLQILLSIAESVKTARDHALNCPKPNL